jgi:hypothetical protein
MLRNLLSGVLGRGGGGRYGRSRSGGGYGNDPGGAVGASVGRSLFSAFRRRR